MHREKIKEKAMQNPTYIKSDGTLNIYALCRDTGLQNTQLKEYFEGKGLSDVNLEKLMTLLNIGLCDV